MNRKLRERNYQEPFDLLYAYWALGCIDFTAEAYEYIFFHVNRLPVETEEVGSEKNWTSLAGIEMTTRAQNIEVLQ